MYGLHVGSDIEVRRVILPIIDILHPHHQLIVIHSALLRALLYATRNAHLTCESICLCNGGNMSRFCGGLTLFIPLCIFKLFVE